MAEPSPEPADAATPDGLSEDRWLGGRLTLLQPRRGHRVGTDAALLVAAAGDVGQGRIVDVGAGVGAVGLALAKLSPLYPSISSRSIRNRWARREQCGGQRASGARARPSARRARPQSAPRGGAGSVRRLRRHQSAVLRRRNGPRLSRRGQGASAYFSAEAGLAYWIEASIAMLAPRGRLVMIHRPDALGAILAAIGAGSAGVALLPVYPKLARARTGCSFRG